jgi:Lrp/AsnC family transcriptional regulator for asnA, asnC and gidA
VDYGMENQTIDNLDRSILNALITNARTPYADLAKQFKVSPATIHVRIEKLKKLGVIEGTHLKVDPKKLGYDVCCFIGINLKSAGDYPEVIEQLKQIDEVVEAYYTTGQYSIFIKIMCKSIDDLQWLLIDKIQSIEKVQATETLISLQNPIARSVKV